MRNLWSFIGGVAVGILAVTGVFATEEENKPRSIENDEGEMEEGEDETEEEEGGEKRLILRSS